MIGTLYFCLAFLLGTLLETAGKNILRNVTEGFGDGGYLWERAGPGQISSDTAFLPGVQAMKIAGGLDYISPRPYVPMVTLTRVFELVKDPKSNQSYPLRHPSTYGTQKFERDGLSRGGQVAQGFGAIKDEQRSALLWTYHHILEPGPAKRNYDTLSPYPHRAVLALANWPISEKEKNPAEVLPRVLHDLIMHYAVFRNRWQDENDIVITGLWGARKEKTGGERLLVWGLGEKLERGACPKVGESKLVTTKPDGSGVLRAGEQSLAVDFSKASGADALLVWVGPSAGGKPKGSGSDKVRTGSVTAGETTYHYLTLALSGKHPEAKAEGSALVVGGQLVTVRDGTLVLEKRAQPTKAAKRRTSTSPCI